MSDIVELPIHFDVPEHYLKIDEFIGFSTDVQKIVNEFNSRIFAGLSDVEVYIIAPESGTFLGKLGIRLTRTSLSVGFIFMALDTDIAKNFVNGLTGHEPSYYAEMSGSEIKKGAIVLADSTRGFLEKNTNARELSSVRPEDFPEAYYAKNNFYQRCLVNERISGVGFTCDDDFPIKRNDFAHRVADSIDGNLELEPEYDTHQFRVVSSVNTIDSKAQWGLQDVQTHRFLNAHLKDDRFQKEFFSGRYPLKLNETDDVMVAMIEYKKLRIDGLPKIVERNIIRVYKFNNIILDEIPRGTIISSVSKIRSGASERQIGLFDSASKIQ